MQCNFVFLSYKTILPLIKTLHCLVKKETERRRRIKRKEERKEWEGRYWSINLSSPALRPEFPPVSRAVSLCSGQSAGLSPTLQLRGRLSWPGCLHSPDTPTIHQLLTRHVLIYCLLIRQLTNTHQTLHQYQYQYQYHLGSTQHHRPMVRLTGPSALQVFFYC